MLRNRLPIIYKAYVDTLAWIDKPSNLCTKIKVACLNMSWILDKQSS